MSAHDWFLSLKPGQTYYSPSEDEKFQLLVQKRPHSWRIKRPHLKAFCYLYFEDNDIYIRWGQNATLRPLRWKEAVLVNTS